MMLKLATKIVSAYVSKNPIATADLNDFIKTVYSALVTTSTPEATAAPERAAPAVSVKKSIAPAELTCLDCGRKFSMVKRHLRTDHGITPEEYRTKWNLPASYPMVAPDYAAKRSELALKIGLGRKPAPMVVEKPKRGRPAKAAAK